MIDWSGEIPIFFVYDLPFATICIKCYNLAYKKSIFMEYGEIKMKFNYNGIWKVLIDKNMKKKDLIDRTGVSPTTISKMVRGEAVSLSVIGKICEELGTDIGDLICIDKNAEEDK